MIRASTIHRVHPARPLRRRPHGHWKVVGTIAAMTCRGMLTCASFDGATDADTFVADVLVRTCGPGG